MITWLCQIRQIPDKAREGLLACSNSGTNQQGGLCSSLSEGRTRSEKVCSSFWAIPQARCPAEEGQYRRYCLDCRAKRDDMDNHTDRVPLFQGLTEEEVGAGEQ